MAGHDLHQHVEISNGGQPRKPGRCGAVEPSMSVNNRGAASPGQETETVPCGGPVCKVPGRDRADDGGVTAHA
jgi:hypothetical protein